MKKLILTGILTLGMGLTVTNAYGAAEVLDRHLVAMNYEYDIEGPGIGEFTEAKYQEIKADRIATAVSEATTLERVLENASRSTRDFEDSYVD